MNYGEGFEDEMALQRTCQTRSEPAEKKQPEERRDIRQDELTGDTGEGRKAERDGAGARHSFLI